MKSTSQNKNQLYKNEIYFWRICYIHICIMRFTQEVHEQPTLHIFCKYFLWISQSVSKPKCLKASWFKRTKVKSRVILISHKVFRGCLVYSSESGLCIIFDESRFKQNTLYEYTQNNLSQMYVFEDCGPP